MAGTALPEKIHNLALPVMTKRQERVAQLKLHGLSTREIAAEVGVSHVTVQKDLRKVMKVWQASTAATYDQLVATRLARYEQLAKALRPGIDRHDWKSIDTAIRLEDRIAKLIGLDAPTKTEVTITLEAIDAEIARLKALDDMPVLEGEVISDDRQG